MKKLTCEMCGGNEIIKQDGTFVCQGCGMKYSAEEAKKMIAECNDDSCSSKNGVDFIEKCLQNARRAKQKEDWGETEKYYNLVEQNDPSNIEAIFYSSYGKAKASLVESDLYKRQAAFKVLQNCVSMLDDNFNVEREQENQKIIDEISEDVLKIACSNYVYNQRKNGYGIVTWTDKKDTVLLFNSLGKEFILTLENIAKKIPDSELSKRKHYYELALNHAEYIQNNGGVSSSDGYSSMITQFHKLINEIDPSHEIPVEAPPATQKQGTGGCYVATAVYGSYDCPQVWTLRRYRDNTLASTWYGRAFIKTYYAVSPTLVKWFGKTAWFQRIWKGKLDRMVSNLQGKGYASTPYNDKEW